MAENDDYLDSIDNNHLDGTNGSLNMTDNSLGVSTLRIYCYLLYVPNYRHICQHQRLKRLGPMITEVILKTYYT